MQIGVAVVPLPRSLSGLSFAATQKNREYLLLLEAAREPLREDQSVPGPSRVLVSLVAVNICTPVCLCGVRVSRKLRSVEKARVLNNRET